MEPIDCLDYFADENISKKADDFEPYDNPESIEDQEIDNIISFTTTKKPRGRRNA